MAEKALHRKRKTGHHDHHLKPGVKWKEPVPDKRDDFDFPLRIFHFICSNISEPHAYGVCYSRLLVPIWISMIEDCCLSISTEPNVLGGLVEEITSKFFGRHHI
jgi:hypothetical protein